MDAVQTLQSGAPQKGCFVKINASNKSLEPIACLINDFKIAKIVQITNTSASNGSFVAYQSLTIQSWATFNDS